VARRDEQREMGLRMTEQNELNAEDGEPRLQVEYWPLDRLIPYARNARTHSAAQVAEIAGSIRAFGFSSPILVSEGGDIIAGPRSIGGRPQTRIDRGAGRHAARFD